MPQPFEFDTPQIPNVQQQQAADFTGSQDDAWGHFFDTVTNAIGRGAATAAPYLADVAAALNSRIASPERAKQALTGGGPATQWASQKYDQIVGPDEPAVNEYEKYGKSAGMMLGASALPLGELAGPRAALGAVTGGLASQAASEEFPNTWWAPLAAGLFGTMAPHIITEGARGVATTRMLQQGADHPAFQDTLNTIISNEGGGTLENPKYSPKGAMGIMQVMPATARDPGFGIKPWDGKTQSDLERVGVQYAAALTKKYDGDQAKILAAYNGGFGRVDKMVRQYGDDWLNHMPDETINYVGKGLKKEGLPAESPTSAPVAETTSGTPAPVSGIDAVLNAAPQTNISTFPVDKSMGPEEAAYKEAYNKFYNASDAETRSIDEDDALYKDMGQKLQEWANADALERAKNNTNPTLLDIAKGLTNRLDNLTPAERQEMDASVERPPSLNNASYDPYGEHTPYVENPPAAANDPTKPTFLQSFINMMKDTSGAGPNPFEGKEPEPGSPEAKLIDAINNVRPASIEAETNWNNLRTNQAAKLAEIQNRNGSIGEQLAALKGGVPKADFEPLDHGLSPDEISGLERTINGTQGLAAFDKLHAMEALHGLLDPNGMRVPTQNELDSLYHVFGPNVVNAIQERVSPTSKPSIPALLWNTVNAAKTIGDWSDLTKSNATMFLTPGYWKTLGNFAKLKFFSGDKYNEIRNITREHPDYPLVQQMNISHTGVGESMNQHEEIFKQNLLEHIPGLRNVMAASERVYSGVANEVRDHAALRMIARDRAAGIDVTNPQYLKDAGELINTLTGRSSFGGTKLGRNLESAMPFISKVLWTPRQYASWVKMAAYAANPKWWYKASPAMRTQLATGVVSLAGTTAAHLAIASSLGYEVHKNVLDPLFGKYKVGDTTYDASHGRGSTIHSIASAVSGLIYKNGHTENLSDNPHANLKTRGDVVMHWMRTHASPAAGLIENEFAGKDLEHPVNAIGQKQDWKALDSTNPLANAMTPMSAEGTMEAAKKYGWNNPQTWETGAGEMIGVQANTLEPRAPKTNGKRQEFEFGSNKKKPFEFGTSTKKGFEF